MADKQNILLIGYGGNNRYLGEICYIDTYAHFCDIFGEKTKLAEAFKTVKDFGCDGVAVMNVDSDKIGTYVDAIEIIKQQDFVYIVPTDIYIGDSYYDTMTCSNIYLLNYMAKQMYECNRSVVIGTDKHASLYEDIDNFITDMTAIEFQVIRDMNDNDYGESLLFVANNLTSYNLSNAVLAAILTNTDVSTYPKSDKFGDAIFDIDANDIGQSSIVYFRSHDDRNTTIENMLNLNINVEPRKIVTIDRIFRYILRNMDFHEFEGIFYNEHVKVQVKKKLEKYMTFYKDYLLIDYKINAINFYKTGPSVGILVCMISVIPIGCFEVCDLKVQVNIN